MQQGYYSLPALLSALDSGKKLKYLWFWGHQPASNNEITASCFSQWWQGSPFTYGSITYATAEHWMMAGKRGCLMTVKRLPEFWLRRPRQKPKSWGGR